MVTIWRIIRRIQCGLHYFIQVNRVPKGSCHAQPQSLFP